MASTHGSNNAHSTREPIEDTLTTEPASGQGKDSGSHTWLSSRRFFSTSVLCLGTVLFALIFNLYRLGAPSLWFDETFSVELARQPLPVLWSTIFGPEPNMELYYLLLHGWLKITTLFGILPVEWIVRLPSAIFAALGSGLVFLIGRRYLGRWAGILAALLYALNYLQLIYAQQTRAYALQLFLINFSWLALLVLCTPTPATSTSEKSGRRRSTPFQHTGWSILYVLATTLAIYTHLFSALVIAAQVIAYVGLWLIPGSWRDSTRRSWRPLMVCLLMVVLLSIPMILESRQGAKTGWLPVPNLAELASLFVILSGSTPRYLLVMIGSILLGLLLLILRPYFRTKRTEVSTSQRRGIFRWLKYIENVVSTGTESTYRENVFPLTWALLCWFIIPIVASYVVSQGSLRLFSTRYLVVITPPFCLLAITAIAQLRKALPRIVLSLILLTCAALVAPHYYQHAQIEDWRTAVYWLQDHYQVDDGLACYDNSINQGCQIAIEYYLQAYPTDTHFTEDTPGLFSWQRFSQNQSQGNLQAPLDPQAMTIFAEHHPHLLVVVGRIPDEQGAAQAQQMINWLNQHYHLVAQFKSSTVTVHDYATGTQINR